MADLCALCGARTGAEAEGASAGGLLSGLLGMWGATPPTRESARRGFRQVAACNARLERGLQGEEPRVRAMAHCGNRRGVGWMKALHGRPVRTLRRSHRR